MKLHLAPLTVVSAKRNPFKTLARGDKMLAALRKGTRGEGRGRGTKAEVMDDAD
ncbi:hypothetical protein [Fervidibacter sacchari]